jgi:hypothetical protein
MQTFAEDTSLMVMAYAALQLAQLPMFAEFPQWLVLSVGFAAVLFLWHLMVRPFVRRLFQR